jgi:RNA polymerase sporulation-specific sigma factor
VRAELVELADRMARGWYLPGADDDDVRQVARIAAWESTRCYRPELGASELGFARIVIGRRLREALTAARRRKHGPLTDAVTVAVDEDGDQVVVLELIPDRRVDVAELVEQRDALGRLVDALGGLTELERRTLVDVANGRTAATASKSVDNALQRARHKLRAA